MPSNGSKTGSSQPMPNHGYAVIYANTAPIILPAGRKGQRECIGSKRRMTGLDLAQEDGGYTGVLGLDSNG